MEIVLKNADFSSVAVTKLTQGYAVNNKNKVVDKTGAIITSQNYCISNAIKITDSMREKGLIVNNSKGNVNSFAVFNFYNSENVSDSTFVGKCDSNDNYTDSFCPKELIPQNASHVVVNGNPDQSSMLFENYLVDVLPIVSTKGSISVSGNITTSDNNSYSQMLPVKPGIKYHLYGSFVAVYDINGVFIKRIDLSSKAYMYLVNNMVFEEGQAFIRIVNYNNLMYLKY